MKWVLRMPRRAIEIEVSDAQPHARLFLSILVQGDPHLEAISMKVPSWLVLEEQAGGGIAGHVDFRPSIAIEIRRDRGESIRSGHFRRRPRTG